jgi:hypothetical protein
MSPHLEAEELATMYAAMQSEFESSGGRVVIEIKHSTDVESTNRVSSSV